MYLYKNLENITDVSGEKHICYCIRKEGKDFFNKKRVSYGYFDIDTDILVERIVNRRSCPQCGEIYNLAFKAPKQEGICDKCQTELTQRKDDTREVAQSRFDTYNKETAPLVEYYKNKGVLRTIDANGTIDEVWERLLKAVND